MLLDALNPVIIARGKQNESKRLTRVLIFPKIEKKKRILNLLKILN